MTGQDLARIHTGDALVAYLAEPDANPTVCDPRARGPHFAPLDEGALTSLVDGVSDGRIDPGSWRRCVDGALGGSSPESTASLVDAIVRGHSSLLRNGDLETSQALQARLSAMHAVYIERPNGLDAHPSVEGPILDEMRRAIESHRLGPVATRFGNELLAINNLEHGLYGGRAVDAALLDDLYARRDEGLLRRFADRLPSKDLRDGARRRFIQSRIAASPYPEVRAAGQEVVQQVLQTGVNAISLMRQPASSVSLNVNLPSWGLLVRQDVLRHTDKLLGYGNRPSVSVLPEVPLSGPLSVEVAGLSRPVTLCQPPGMLDPSPCIGADDVKIESPLAYLERDGAIRFVDQITSQDAASLARMSQSAVIPVSVGGHRVVSLARRLWFQRPDSLVLSGTFGNGPDLRVTIDQTESSRYSFSVSDGKAEYPVVVEKSDLPSFRIVSRGAGGSDGAPGSSGMDGTSGLDGSSASCPSMAGSDGGRGGDGSNGASGGNGGDGGDGGDIQVEVDCGAAGCPPEILDSLRMIIVSEGGPGGRGGAGGRGGGGGRGGSGGSSTSCIDSNSGTGSSLAGGSSGMNGSDGSSGLSGTDGSPGRAGHVRFSVARRSPP